MSLITYALVLMTGVINAIHSGTNAKLNESLEHPWWADGALMLAGLALVCLF